MNNNKKIIILAIILVIAWGVTYVLRSTLASRAQVSASSVALSAGRPGSMAASPGFAGELASQDSIAQYARKDGVATRAENSVRGPIQPPVTALPPEPAQEKRLIIQTGQMSLVVKNVSSTIDIIAGLAVKNNGYVVEKNFYKSDSAPSGYVTVRIPATVFEQGLGAFRALGDVVSESLSGTDVTAEYVDLNSQLRNFRATETQLLEILKRAGTISDVLEVQNQLTSIRGQIESTQGRIKYLEQSSAYSVLTINLSTDRNTLPVVVKEGTAWKPLATFKAAIRSLLEIGRAFVDLGIWFVVYLPLWIVILFIIWLIVRKLWPYILKKM